MSKWAGWCKRTPRSTWERIAEGDTLTEVSRRMSAALRGSGIPTTRQVITSGPPPDSERDAHQEDVHHG